MNGSIGAIKRRTRHLLLYLALLPLGAALGVAGTVKAEVRFAIKEFVLDGNSIFHDDRLMKTVKPFLGENKTSQDVEQARAAVEKYYHEGGYPTVLVNIPEQTVESGIVRLEIIESLIRRVKVSGNRYFTRDGLLREMPAFRPGEILYLPRVKEQLARVNRNPDLKVAPVLAPGKKLGTIDVEFRVKDKLPLHGELEYNNRSTHTTTDTRLNGILRYDNLWQKEHSIMLQYQTSPEDTDEVELFIGTYGLPSPLNPDHLATLYGVWSDSATATAGDITVVGEGNIFGLRYLIPLPSVESYIHDLTFGMDYKDFEDTVAGEIPTRVNYMVVNANYSAVMPDDLGQTGFSLGVNFNLRQTDSDVVQFQQKRAESHGNFLVFKAELERDQKLFLGSRLWVKGQYQWANQALISNEQYIAGGINSVRGYKENEAAGDLAGYVTAELQGPDIGQAIGIGRWFEFTPYLFYDYAELEVLEPLPGETIRYHLAGAGAGVRGYFLKMFEYEVNWATALKETEDTQKDEHLTHFIVKFKF